MVKTHCACPTGSITCSRKNAPKITPRFAPHDGHSCRVRHEKVSQQPSRRQESHRRRANPTRGSRSRGSARPPRRRVLARTRTSPRSDPPTRRGAARRESPRVSTAAGTSVGGPARYAAFQATHVRRNVPSGPRPLICTPGQCEVVRDGRDRRRVEERPYLTRSIVAPMMNPLK